MRAKTSAYETRCPRCNVSFPPETRKCIHCGGATGKPRAQLVETWTANESRDSISEGPAPIEPEDESIFSMETAGPGEEGAESGSSLPRTLLRTFGSLIWIGLLIAFTLARDCGGE